MASEPVVLHSTEADGAIHIVTINRPQALNALSPTVMKEVARIFHQLRTDEKVRCIILTGAGKAFSAGIDLTQAGDVFGGGALSSAPREEEPSIQVETFPWPVICAVNGFAITGGFELALCCDILIASENAKFADTHAKFGIAPSWGLSQKLSRTVGTSRAKELHFTARMLSAQEAKDWGLVNIVVPPDQLMPHCLSLARQMLNMQPHMLQLYKKTVDEGIRMSFKDALKYEKKEAKEYYKKMTPEMFAQMNAFIKGRSNKPKAKL